MKNAVSLSKGKSKNLASTPRNNDFKELIAKLQGSQVIFLFVSNAKTDEEIKKISSEPSMVLIKSFWDNLKSVGFGTKFEAKKISFFILLKSSKEGINALYGLLKPQLDNFNPAVLMTLNALITPQGTEIIKNLIKTIKLTKNNEFLNISFYITEKDMKKIPEILLMLGMSPLNNKQFQQKLNFAK